MAASVGVQYPYQPNKVDIDIPGPLPSPALSQSSDLPTPTTPYPAQHPAPYTSRHPHSTSQQEHAYSQPHSPNPSQSPSNSPNPSDGDPDADQDRDEEFGFSQPEDIKRRRRTTPEELAILEQEYARCTLPDAKNRVRIGLMTNMSARSVQIWFQNKRQTDKRKAQGLTRRPPRRVPVEPASASSDNSHPQFARTLSSASLSTGSLTPSATPTLSEMEFDQLRRKRKTLEQAASEAQRRLPTSPDPRAAGAGMQQQQQELNAALTIARMHSAPFRPSSAQGQPQGQRRALGQLNPNTLHPPPQPGMMRHASSAGLPSSFIRSGPLAAGRPEPPALVRAYSLPSQALPSAFSHKAQAPYSRISPNLDRPQRQYQTQQGKTEQEPIWERMLSSPSSSPYIAPFMRKRSLDSVPTLSSSNAFTRSSAAANARSGQPAAAAAAAGWGSHAVPFRPSGYPPAAKRARLSLSPVSPAIVLPNEEDGNSSSSSDEEPDQHLSSPSEEGRSSPISASSASFSQQRTATASQKHEEQEDDPEPDLSFDSSVSSQTSESSLLTPNTSLLSSETFVLSRPASPAALCSSEPKAGQSNTDRQRMGKENVPPVFAAVKKKMEEVGAKFEKKGEVLPRDWEKEAAELLCFMASGRGEAPAVGGRR